MGYIFPELIVPVKNGLIYIFKLPFDRVPSELRSYGIKILNGTPGIEIEDTFFIPFSEIDINYLLKIKQPVIMIGIKEEDNKYVRYLGAIDVSEPLLFEVKAAYYAFNLLQT